MLNTTRIETVVSKRSRGVTHISILPATTSKSSFNYCALRGITTRGITASAAISHDHPPCLQLLVERSARMRGTRRRETGIHERRKVHLLQHVTSVRHLRLRAVEEDVRDVRVHTEEGREIARHLRGPLDTRIEAALPAARLKHIPQRNSIR